MNKKLLLSSVFSAFMCLSAIIGSTYALLTDETKKDLEVTSGNVDIDASFSEPILYSPNLISSDGEIIDATNIATSKQFGNGGNVEIIGNEISINNISRGDQAKIYINIENKSDIQIQYIASLYTEDENDLFSQLEIEFCKKPVYSLGMNTMWTLLEPFGKVEPLELVVRLPSYATGDYEGKSVNFALNVKAVQSNIDTNEHESLIYNNDTENRLDMSESLYLEGRGGSVKVEENTELGIYGNYTIEAQEKDDNAVAIWADGSNSRIFIKNGAYTQDVSGNLERYDLIKATNGGHIIIKGGVYRSFTPEYTFYVDDIKNSTIRVKGGRFYKFDPSNVKLDTGEIVNFVDSGYYVVQERDWYVVKPHAFYFDAGENAWMIGSREAFLEFANEVNFNKVTFEGETVKLSTNVDLEFENWLPIGLNRGNAFKGIFDGNGFTVYRLKVHRTLEEIKVDGRGGNAYSKNVGYGGLFGHCLASKICNLNIHDVDIYAGHFVGAFVGDGESSIDVLDNLSLTGLVQIYAWKAAGGIIGTSADSMTNITIDVEEGSFINNAYIMHEVLNTQNIDYIGGIFGHGWPNLLQDVKCNLDVYGSAYGIGGISGATADRYINVHYSGHVSMALGYKSVMYQNTIEDGNCFGDAYMYQSIGFISGFGSENGVTRYKNCTSNGTMTIYLEDGTVLDNNGRYFKNINGELVQDSRFGICRYSRTNADNIAVLINDSVD